AISTGKLLYTDIRYYYGPFAPYLNALLFKTFGVHLLVVVSAGLTSSALVTYVLYRISRFWMSRADATLVAAAFIYLCAFSRNGPYAIFNFVTPYTYSAVYGMAAALGSLYFLLKYIIEQKAWAFPVS